MAVNVIISNSSQSAIEAKFQFKLIVFIIIIIIIFYCFHSQQLIKIIQDNVPFPLTASKRHSKGCEAKA